LSFENFTLILPDQKCGSSSVGRASASQAEGRGFEPHLPLHIYRKPFSKGKEGKHTASFFYYKEFSPTTLVALPLKRDHNSIEGKEK
jgi:hypothetical protein